MGIPGLLDAIGLDAAEELVAIKEDRFISCKSRLGHNSFFFFLILYSLRHCGAAYQAEILGAASRAETADIEQMKKIVPLITCEISFGQNVCELMFGVNVTDLDFWVQINPVNQPIQSNSVRPWNMPYCGTSTFDNHLNYRLIVLKDIPHSTGIRLRCIWWNVINFCWIDVGVLDWDGVMHVWLCGLQRVSPWLSLSLLGPFVLFGTEWNTSITKSQRVRAGIPSMRKPASRDMISAPVELCETEACFLHIQLLGTNVWLPRMRRIPPDVDLESFRSPAKSESWNNPSLHCCVVFLT